MFPADELCTLALWNSGILKKQRKEENRIKYVLI